MMFDHQLRLTHRRHPIIRRMGEVDPAQSEVEVDASSQDLTACWRELLSRLPNDVYAALKAAMAEAVE